MDVDGPLQNKGPIANGGVRQLGPSEGLTGLAKQGFQQAKLRRSKIELTTLDESQVPMPVNAHPPLIRHVRGNRNSSAGALMGFDPLHECFHAEWLGDE